MVKPFSCSVGAMKIRQRRLLTTRQFCKLQAACQGIREDKRIARNTRHGAWMGRYDSGRRGYAATVEEQAIAAYSALA
ncbi:hypothetical protein [Herbaspirillum rhizosphaerae]|uniref:hypothetical protein n=1 Tax=Herbaspirillum rhizosphaerae TaxID=346179 RepID=UPI0012EDAF00|nr:hypothetical protein [Herbaspirillum rhizosphaerae]